MDKIDLKPCPFCGNQAEVSHYDRSRSIWCGNDECEMIGFIDIKSSDFSAVVDKWNTRPGENN